MFINIEQNTPEWLEYRGSKFNASEAGDVMGVGFNKPYVLAQIKKGQKAVFENQAMKNGKNYEPDLRAWLNKTMHYDFLPAVMQSDKDKRFSASLDGLDIMADVICEIKFSDAEYKQVKECGVPSKKYYYQVQHQLYVSEAKKCIFAVGHLNDDFELEAVTCEVLPNKKAINELKNAWNAFEKEYLQDDEANNEWLELASELSELNAQKSELEAKIAELKAKAIEKADGREQAHFGLSVYKINRKAQPDYKGYCEFMGYDVPSEFIRPESSSWAVRV